MKTITRFLSKILISGLVLVFMSLSTFADMPSVEPKISTDNNQSTYSLRKEDIRWKYKNIGGRLHRRQYNYTRGEWIGSWEAL